jgi:protein arginine kinase activator
MTMVEKKSDEPIPDRPLECSECKKQIAVRYVEIVGQTMTQTSMCADCPELQKRLHGTHPKELVAAQMAVGAELQCGNCGTTLEDVRHGHRLGCAECYNVFGDVLLMEMKAAKRLSPRLFPTKKIGPIHIGRSPGEGLTINLSTRLVALNEALKETLKREDYEQAALLRDQIKALTEEQQGGEDDDRKK